MNALAKISLLGWIKCRKRLIDGAPTLFYQLLPVISADRIMNISPPTCCPVPGRLAHRLCDVNLETVKVDLARLTDRRGQQWIRPRDWPPAASSSGSL